MIKKVKKIIDKLIVPEKLENLIVLLKLGLLQRYLKQVEMVLCYQKYSSDRENS